MAPKRRWFDILSSDSEDDIVEIEPPVRHSESSNSDDVIVLDPADSKSVQKVSDRKTGTEISDQKICSACGRLVPTANMHLHSGRCRPIPVSSNSDTSASSASGSHELARDQPDLAVLRGVLPSWSDGHLRALRTFGGANDAYEAVLALCAGTPFDPDSLPLSFRDAIVKESEERQRTASVSEPPHHFSSSSSSSSGASVSTGGVPTQPPEFFSYAFRLLRSDGAVSSGNDGCVTLGELIPDNGRLRSAVVFNMMVDFDFLCEEVPALRTLSGSQLTVIHGANQLFGRLPHGATLHAPPLPPYGSHHSKGILAFYGPSSQSTTAARRSSGSGGGGPLRNGGEEEERGLLDRAHLVVLVTTANFIHVDVRCKTNGVWVGRCPEKASSPELTPSVPSCPFEEELVRYFNHYNLRARAVLEGTHGHGRGAGRGGDGGGGGGHRAAPSSSSASWAGPQNSSSRRCEVVDVSLLQRYDFRHASRGVKLVASTPGLSPQGLHKGADVKRWGHMGLRAALRPVRGPWWPQRQAQSRPSPFFPSSSSSSSSFSSSSSISSAAPPVSSSPSQPPKRDLRLSCQFTSAGAVAEKTFALQWVDSFLGFDDGDNLLRASYGSKPVSSLPGRGGKGKSSGGGGWMACAKVPCSLVVPSEEKVRCSTEGYAGGASIPLPEKNIGQAWVAPLLCHYGDGRGALNGRGRTLPHIKSYCLYEVEEGSPPQSGSALDEESEEGERLRAVRALKASGGGVTAAAAPVGGGGGGGGDAATPTMPPPHVKVHWFLMTSANFSNTAWGQLQNLERGSSERGESQTSLKLASYELGVLFFNEEDPGEDGSAVRALAPIYSHSPPPLGRERGQSTSRLLPVPYELPPRRYRAYDEPWTSDREHHQPDGLGRQWPCEVSLWGPHATSRQGFARSPPQDADPHAAVVS